MSPRTTTIGPDLLHTALARICAAFGARVRVVPGADNSVRTLHGEDRRPHMWTHEIDVEGTVNLAHEVGHLAFAGHLDDDHGIDYHQIPYDLEGVVGRTMLAEELACSTFSCGVLATTLVARGVRNAEIDGRVDAWFAEQLEIQPVFYQREPSLPAFIRSVEDFVMNTSSDLVTKCDLLYETVGEWMTGVGVPVACSDQVRYDVVALVGRYMQRRGRVVGVASTEDGASGGAT